MRHVRQPAAAHAPRRPLRQHADVEDPSKLLSKLDHAITALRAGQTAAAATDLAAYIDAVRSARGKTIPAATADLLIAKAQHIRTVLGY
jgi:hypothetical protein